MGIFLGGVLFTEELTWDVWLECPRGFSETSFFTRECVMENVRGKLSGVGVQIPEQDYESLSPAVMISATLVNAQTHTQTHRQTQLLAGYIRLVQRLLS